MQKTFNNFCGFPDRTKMEDFLNENLWARLPEERAAVDILMLKAQDNEELLRKCAIITSSTAKHLWPEIVWAHKFNNVSDIGADETSINKAAMIFSLIKHWDRNAMEDYDSAVKELAAQSVEELAVRILNDQKIAMEPPLEDEEIIFTSGSDCTEDDRGYFVSEDPEFHF